MRKILKPNEDTQEVFLNCISSYKDLDLKSRLEQIATLISDKALQFEQLISCNKLYTIEKNKIKKATRNNRIFNNIVTVPEAKDIYTNGFSGKDSPGRELYDRIIMSAPYSKCPYCFHRNVTTIDHYLPKAYYPLLSVVPINLVPSCTDCNTGALRASYPQKSSDEILHPYYDDVENELWLKAKVKQTSPATISFFVDPPKDWTNILKERLDNHFESLQLNKLYSIESALELINIEWQCQQQYNTGGAAAVKKHLTETAESKKAAFLNSWQTALYCALAVDDWFHERGFMT